ncbi:MAG: dephospho-CoA kinase [Aquabacterium sp.]|nr:dephospho-CoA kinase [Aquabacterium sp.]
MASQGIQAIGLTGGIGSGKSTVAAQLVALGATLVDTDAIAHALTTPGGAAMPALRQRFGDDVAGPDGALDRARMRTLVFADPDAKRALEAILHPMIGAEAQRQAAAAGDGVVVFDVPLLSESSHWRARCQRILVVDCSAETQVQRVMARSGWSDEQVRRVIALQSPRAQRRAIADAVIFNDGITAETLADEVAQLWALWGLPRPVRPVKEGAPGA